MAAKDLEELLKDMFQNNEDAREHLRYLKAAYAKHKKFAKLKESVVEKLLSAFSMAVLIFIGSAVLTELKKYIK